MYDPSNEPREFVGLAREDAVAKACAFFRLSEEALAIHELDPKEVYGLASRTVIVAIPLERRARESGRAAAGGEDSRGSRGGRRRREEAPSGERRGRPDGRSARGEKERVGLRAAEGRGGRGAEGREPRGESRGEAAALREPSIGAVRGEVGEIGRFVLGALERMDLGPFEISESDEEGLIALSLRGPAARELGSGDGRPVDALQLLANQAAMRLSEDAKRIVLDVEGDLEQREGRLSELAERAARWARETGRAIALDPMSPRDRRIIHLALRDAEAVATMSVGEGRYRQVVVVPEGAPEYEQAVRESRAAAGAAEREG
jgi:predicted RNA-binding protein Jag